MKQAEILEYIRNGESSTVEFKTEDVHPNALAEEIVAFANLEPDIRCEFALTPDFSEFIVTYKNLKSVG